MAMIIDITLRMNGANNAATDLSNVTTQVQQLGDEVQTSGNQITNSVGGMGAQFERLKNFAIGFVVFDKLKDYALKALDLADAWTILTGKMELATGSSEGAAVATNDLYNMAQQLRVPLAETGTLFGRLVPALKEYGGGTAEATRMTEALSLSLKVSGATQAESASSMLQFSQAMAGGALRGEEFNAMADASPRLLQALADGLGVSRGELKSLAEQGKLTTDVVYAAVSKQLPLLKEEFGKIPLTVGDAWTLLGNAAMKGVGELDAAFKTLDSDYKISENIAYGIKAIADNLPAVARGFLILAEAVAAYYLVMRGGPALIGAVTTAKTLLTAAMVRWQASAVTGTSVWSRLNSAFSTSPGIIARCSTAIGALTVAGGVMAAAFIGWEIGSWLYDEFAWARNAGIMFISGMLKGWEQLKYGASVAWEYIKYSFANMGDEIKKEFGAIISFLASAADKVGADDLAKKLKSFSAGLTESKTAATKLQESVAALTKARDAEIRTIDTIIVDMLDESDTRGKVTAGTKKQAEASDELNKKQKISAEDAKKLTTEFDKLTEALDVQSESLTLTANGQNQLTDTQKLTAKATEFLTQMGDKLTVSQRGQLQAFIQSLPGLEAQAVAAKKAADAQADYTKKLDDGLKAVQDKLAKAVEDRESMGKTESQIAELTVARDRENLALLLNRQSTEGHSAALDHEIDVVQNRIAVGDKLVAQLKDNEGFKQQQAQIKENTESWNKFSDDIGKAFSDGFMRMLEDGKGGWDAFTSSIKNTFKKTLVDWIYTAFAKPIILNVVAGLSGSGGGGLMGAISSANSGMNLLSKLGSLGSIFKAGGYFGAGGTVAGAIGGGISSFGSMIGSTSLQGFGGGMTVGYGNGSLASGLGAKAGAAVPWLAGIGLGVGAGRLISGEYSVGGNKNTAVGIGTAIGAVVGGPIGAAIGGAIGGLVNRAFGRGEKKTKSFGIEGNFTGDDFSGQNYKNWKQKGGWFRSDKKGTDYSALDGDTENAMDTGFFTLKQSLAGYATSLGLATNTITGYSKQIKLELTDDEAANSQKIADLFGDMGDEMAKGLIPNIADFAFKGELASETLQRLASVFDVTSATASLLGANFETAFANFDLGTAHARQSLIDLSGGLEAFSEKVAFYYDNFYSDKEKGDRAFAELDAKFDQLGLSIELSKDAFRAQMEEVNLTQSPEQYAALLDLAPLFTQVLTAMGDSAAGQKVGVGIDATGLSERQLADINQSAETWFSGYQPQLEAQAKARADEAAKTTAAIENLTAISAEASEAVRSAIATGNTSLEGIIAAIYASGIAGEAMGRAIADAVARASNKTATAVETAVASGQRN